MTSIRWTARRLFSAALTTLFLGVAFAQPAPTPPAAQPAPPEPLSVEEAVAYALQHNPSIVLNQQNVQIAQYGVGSARANGLPNVALNATGTYVPSPPTVEFDGQEIETGNMFSASAGVTATQPVWPPSRWRAPVAAARANVGITETNLARTRQQVAFQTRQAFYQLLSAQELLAVAQYALTVAQTQLRLANATFAAGTAPRLDVEQALATVANAEVSLTQAQNGVDIAQAALAVQIGLPAGTPVQIEPTPGLPSVPAQVDPLIAEALAQRPEIVQLNFRRQQIRANIDQIRLQSQPLVTLQGSYNQTLVGGSLFGADGLTFAANVAFNLFNGGRTRYDLAAARTQLEQVDTTARQIELGITLDVRSAWLNLQNAIRQLSSAAQQRTAAEEALRISQLRYQEGEGIQLEVEQAQLRVTQALTALAQARFQAQIAAAQLQYAIGMPVTTAVPTTPAPASMTPPTVPPATAPPAQP